ncbi:hypothetical protein EJ110_NYTH00017 [Nymphaea thermarum]|nr:hypothetical protein EJ110_NYTH00017 [Nymphaea thermarum]
MHVHGMLRFPNLNPNHYVIAITFLDKATIVDQEALKISPAAANMGCHHPWRMATVTQVGETKQLLSMVPSASHRARPPSSGRATSPTASSRLTFRSTPHYPPPLFHLHPPSLFHLHHD